MRALLIVGGGLRGGGGADNTWGFVEQNTLVASKGCWDEQFFFLFIFLGWLSAEMESAPMKSSWPHRLHTQTPHPPPLST